MGLGDPQTTSSSCAIPTQRPLTAFGDSPIGEALVDWRCFYLGSDQPGGKCRNDEQPFGRGWDWLAPQFDLEWGCRKPYIIVIGDGENNCQGENPAADTANLRRNRVQAWVINFGGPDSRDLRSLAQNTGGEYIEVANRDELLTVLQNILGIIVEETKAFASAVVPTVQAQEADKIYISNFKPLNQAPVWPGALQAFLKPVPVASGKARYVDRLCQRSRHRSGIRVLPLERRRRDGRSGQPGPHRSIRHRAAAAPGLLLRSVDVRSMAERQAVPRADRERCDARGVRYDFWRALNMPGHDWDSTADDSLPDADEDALELAANDVVAKLMELKVDDNDTPADLTDDVDYIMGDIFHSDPLILGSPVNTKYFGQNVEDDGTLCENGNPGYRCFFRKHQYRRRVVLLGSNDTQVHAIDAGIYRTGGAFADQFDRGTGREIFAFSPRAVMPLVEDMFGPSPITRTWAVDGDIVGFDAFIDPLHNGTPDTGRPRMAHARRRWPAPRRRGLLRSRSHPAGYL